MTIDQVVVKYVYQHNKLALNGLGIFELTEAVPDDEYIQKHRQIPVGGFKFTYQPKVETDPAFISFYGEQRGKIPSLSVSDIYTYLQMATQLLNIGNPYELKGLSTLNKQNNGSLVAEPGFYVSFKDVSGAPARLRERQDAKAESFKTEDETESSGLSPKARKLLIGFLIGLLIGVGGWFGYKQLWGGSSSVPSASTDSTTQAQPPAQVITPQADSNQNTNLIATTPIPAGAVDSNTVITWRGILNEATSKEAGKAMAKTYSRFASKIVVETADSVNFKAYVLVNYAPKDTARAIDSLKRFFARRSIKLEPAPAQQ